MEQLKRKKIIIKNNKNKQFGFEDILSNPTKNNFKIKKNEETTEDFYNRLIDNELHNEGVLYNTYCLFYNSSDYNVLFNHELLEKKALYYNIKYDSLIKYIFFLLSIEYVSIKDMKNFLEYDEALHEENNRLDKHKVFFELMFGLYFQLFIPNYGENFFNELFPKNKHIALTNDRMFFSNNQKVIYYGTLEKNSYKNFDNCFNNIKEFIQIINNEDLILEQNGDFYFSLFRLQNRRYLEDVQPINKEDENIVNFHVFSNFKVDPNREIHECSKAFFYVVNILFLMGFARKNNINDYYLKSIDLNKAKQFLELIDKGFFRFLNMFSGFTNSQFNDAYQEIMKYGFLDLYWKDNQKFHQILENTDDYLICYSKEKIIE